MKKTLIALAALAATSAFAQSSVTIYGRLDAGYSATTTTTTTAAGVSTEDKNNGINTDGLATSLWGMKGVEDLGGGLKASFQLEQGVAMDSGLISSTTGANIAPTAKGAPIAAEAQGFNRVSTLGLSGNFGEVKIGRDYTPLFSTIGASDVFGTTGATTVTNFPDGVRASDMVSYSTPNMSGFSAKVMLGRNDNSGAATKTSGNTGLSLSYAAGPLMVGLAWGEIIGNGTVTAGVESKQSGAALVGTYNFGVAKLFAGHTRAKVQTNTAVDTYNESNETNLGVTVPMGAATFMAGIGRNNQDVRTLGVTDGQSGNDYVLGVTYDLSKRTALYLKTGVYNKLDNTAALAGNKAQTTALGVKHTF